MELRQLRTFEVVVRERTITEAANALGLAPSSVSDQIRALERSLDMPLFDREPRGMRLTAAGERLLLWARRLLDQADQARRDVTGRPPALRMGALETLAAVHAPRVLARLAERRPGLDVEVRPMVSRDRILAEVVAADLDAGLLLDTGDALGELGFAPPPAPLAFLDLAPVPLALVAAPGHSLVGRPRLRPADVAEHRLLGNVPSCSIWLAADRIFGREMRRVEAGGLAVVRAWATQGLGLALLPEFFIATELTDGTLARLDLDTPALALRLIWRPDREPALPGLREMLYAISDTAAEQT